MAAALISRQSVVALATEGTAGTAESLSLSDGAINCYDASYTPEVTMSERMSQGAYDANLTSVAGARTGRISFRTDLLDDSSSFFFSRILVHAGFSVSSLTAQSTGSISTSTATVAAYVDGLRHQLAGCVASSVQIDFEAGQPVYASVEYAGKYAAPTDTALITPTYPTALPVRFASGDLTFASATIPTFSGNIRIENQFAMRPDPTDATGYLHAQITRQTITASLNVEATLEATRDDFAEWIAQTTGSLVLDVGPVVTLTNAQRINVQPGDTNGIHSRQIDFLHTRGSGTFSTIVMSS